MNHEQLTTALPAAAEEAHQHAELLAFPAGDELGQLGHRGVAIERRYGHRVPCLGPHQGGQLDQLDRVSSQQEEVILDADPLMAQHLLPLLAQLSLE